MVFDVVVVGSCNVDLVNYVDNMPATGETITGNLFEMNFGGKGANQAVMCHLLGAKVCMLGKVGDEFFGKNYLNHLQKLNFNTDHIIVAGKGSVTGTASIIVNKAGDNCIILNPGANYEVDEEFIKAELPSLLCERSIVLLQMEIPSSSTLAALKLAKSKGAFTILNPAPATNFIHSEFYEYSDVVCCNEVEIEQLSGRNIRDSFDIIATAASTFLNTVCKHVIVTLGEAGAYIVNDDHPRGKLIPITVPIDKVYDTTGSGDAFVGALAYFISQDAKDTGHYRITDRSISNAVNAASLTVTAKGAQSSYLKVIDGIKSFQN